MREHTATAVLCGGLGMVPSVPLGGMIGGLLVLVLIASTSAQVEPAALVDPVAVSLEAKINVAAELPAQGVGAGAGNAPPVAVPEGAVVAQQCIGVPQPTSYVQAWTCAGLECTGTCVSGTKAPYGPPVARCTAGRWEPVGPGCLAGGIYNFDDIATDGSLPSRYLGLQWTGLRVTNSQRFTACEGNNGFRYGVISGPNVAYSLEIGATGDLTNLVRITAPTPQSRISVLGFTATAAWQDGLRIDISAWDAQNRQLGLAAYQLSFFRPTVIDLRTDLRFSGIYRFQIISSGGQKVSCATGKQVVIDNMDIYLHGE